MLEPFQLNCPVCIDLFCAIWRKGDLWQKHFAFSMGDLTDHVSHIRVMASIDVSAASSADPKAKYLLDAAIDMPLQDSIYSRLWFWGYARLSSIQDPKSVGEISSPSAPIQALLAEAPSSIVQSFEATAGMEVRLHSLNWKWGRRPVTISALADGGVITPLSLSQAAPTVYVASSAIQNYYTLQANLNPSMVNMENSTAIMENCTAAAGAPAPTCYIAKYAEERDRFFHNYGGGLRIKRYYYNDTDEEFIFPASFDFTFGQNDYVTGGHLRRYVAHFGGYTPIPSKSPVFAGLYVYALFDMVLAQSSVPNQQFVLQVAPATVILTSPNVASIFVGQPDRDRYRFGIAYDLNTLAKKFAGK